MDYEDRLAAIIARLDYLAAELGYEVPEDDDELTLDTIEARIIAIHEHIDRA